MSLARSFTSRMRARFDDSAAPPNRAFSTKAAPSSGPRDRNIDRRLISLPVELLSTSNAQAYEAPDIKALIDRPAAPATPTSPSRGALHVPLAPMSPFAPMHALTTDEPDLLSPALTASSASSTRSWDDSGLASPALTAASSVTSADGCSREPSPANCDPNPMSSTFFQDRELEPADEEPRRSGRPLVSPTVPHTVRPLISPTAPAIPIRAPSPIKEAPPPKREASPPPPAPAALAPASPPSKPLAPAIGNDHPFGAELATVEELAEAFGGSGAVHVVDPETQELLDQGFFCFAATDYLDEIQPLFSRVFASTIPLPEIVEWI